jgi:hypothetical protein
VGDVELARSPDRRLIVCMGETTNGTGENCMLITYRTSQRRPSVALCCPDFSSLRTRSCRVWDSAGALLYRS